MTSVQQLRDPEFRERVIDAVLEVLAHLPQMQRNIFIWSHYKGYEAGKIAEILSCNQDHSEFVSAWLSDDNHTDLHLFQYFCPHMFNCVNVYGLAG